MRLHIVGVDSVAKLIESTTNNVDYYKLVVQTDEFQCQKPPHERAFIVDIIDVGDEEETLADLFRKHEGDDYE